MKLTCHLELRRKERSDLDFRGKAGESQVDEKAQTFGERFLLATQKQGDGGILRRDFARFLPVCYVWFALC